MLDEQKPDYTRQAMDAMSVVLSDKRQDYARGSEDPFINFKETAEITGSTPIKVALTMAAVKLSRLNHLLDSTEPVNESVGDSLLDLANYAALALAMYLEASNE